MTEKANTRRKYATPEEAHQAKLQRMRERYQEKKKAALEAAQNNPEEVKQVEKPKAPRKSPYIRWDEIDKLFGIFQKKSTGENDDEYEYEEEEEEVFETDNNINENKYSEKIEE